MNPLKKYGFVWVTLAFFILSLAGHWLLAWFAFVHEQQAHHQPVELASFFIEAGRDTLENWQSEFLQLIWQVWGLSFLLYVGSSQSKEGEERKEEKLDYIIKQLSPEKADQILQDLERKFPKE